MPAQGAILSAFAAMKKRYSYASMASYSASVSPVTGSINPQMHERSAFFILVENMIEAIQIV